MKTKYIYKDNLKSQRLVTRFLNEKDISLWTDFLNDKECIEFFPSNEWKSVKERSAFWIDKQLMRYADNKFGLQALIDKNK